MFQKAFISILILALIGVGIYAIGMTRSRDGYRGIVEEQLR